ncbi:MAG: hypothetical protein ACTHYO_14365 [Micrococcaceae bacterium]
MSSVALPVPRSRFLPSQQFLRQAGIYAGAALTIITVFVWAPLRFAYPVVLEAGEITTSGVGNVLWLVTAMTMGVTITAGGVLSVGRSATAAPLVGCTFAAILFAVVSLNIPIW